MSQDFGVDAKFTDSRSTETLDLNTQMSSKPLANPILGYNFARFQPDLRETTHSYPTNCFVAALISDYLQAVPDLAIEGAAVVVS